MDVQTVKTEQDLILAVEDYLSRQQDAIDRLTNALEIYREFLLDRIKKVRDVSG